MAKEITANLERRQLDSELSKVVKIGEEAKAIIAANPHLMEEELQAYQRQVSEGERAKEQLCISCLVSAKKQALQLHKKTGTYSFEDLVQDAMVGVVKAVNDFDPSRNCTLATYAHKKIYKEISVELNKMRPVRLPENKMHEHLFITRAEAEYSRLLGEGTAPADLTKDEFISKETGLSLERIGLIRNTLRGTVSLDAPYGDSETELIDLIDKGVDETPSIIIKDERLNKIFAYLTDYERNIIALCYEVGALTKSRSSFMAENNLTREKLQSEHKRVLAKMRKITREIQVA